MRREQLQELGGFVSEKPVERELTWETPGKESVTFTVFVRQLPFSEFEEFAAADLSDMEKMFRFIGRTIMLDSDDGPQFMGLEDAKRLNQSLAMALVKVAQEVNGLGEKN